MYNGRLPEPGVKPGGVDVFVHRVAEALQGRGHDVSILTYTADPVAHSYDVQTIRPRAGYSSKFVKKYVASWGLNVRRFSDHDVLHLHGDDWFFHRRRIPTVRTFYGSALLEALTATSWKRRVDQSLGFLLELQSARLATGRYGIGRDSQLLYSTHGILGCGVAQPSAPPAPAAVPTIAFIGTWHGRKRGSLLHRAFIDEVLPLHPDAQLIMVSDQCEPGPNVQWIEHPSDARITEILLSSWVFCLPSAYEGLGLPYLEAMSCGVPVVATSNPGAEDLLRSGGAGLIVDDSELGPALCRLIASPGLRAELSAAGGRRAAGFSWDRICEEYERAYERAISDWAAPQLTGR